MGRLIAKKALGSLLTLAFVLVFNFFLFRIVQPDPIRNLFRGRNVPQAQLDKMRADFGLDDSLLIQFWAYIKQTASLNFGLSYQSRQPVWDDIAGKIWPTVLLVGTCGGSFGATGCPRRCGGRLAARLESRLHHHLHHDGVLLNAGLLARYDSAGRLCGCTALVSSRWYDRHRDQGIWACAPD